jgi:hypothetical protein
MGYAKRQWEEESREAIHAPIKQFVKPRPPVLPALVVAYHWTGAVVDLGFFSRRGEDHRARLWLLVPAQFAHKTLDALITAGKAGCGN